MIGLYIECETCGKTSRIEATSSLTAEKVGHDLSCGHRNGWSPDVAFPERFRNGSLLESVAQKDGSVESLSEQVHTEMSGD
jgi:hypothetical protein